MATATLLFLGDIGTSELLLIAGVLLLFFGAKRLPELARGLGTGLREFKGAARATHPGPEQPRRPVAYPPAAPGAPVLYPGYPHGTYFAPAEPPAAGPSA